MKEPPSSANQDGHWISPSCMRIGLARRWHPRCDADHRKALFTPPRRVERLPMARGRLERRGGRVAVVPLSAHILPRGRGISPDGSQEGYFAPASTTSTLTFARPFPLMPSV